VTFPALYERTLEVVWKGSPHLSWVDLFDVKSLGMTTKKKQSPNCSVIVKRPPAGREEVDRGRERTNHIVE